MAMVVRVKPEYNGKISIQSNTTLNETVLSNNLSQETLLSIFLSEAGLREFLYTEYTTANGSYAPSQIDPSLLHVYDASEITQNPAKTDYPAGTVGKYLNEIGNKINSISTISTRPQSILDFAGAKMLPSYATFSRASTGSYVDVNGIIKIAKAGQPRFTHNPVTKESLGILIEEARTNILTNSNSTVSGNVNSVITANSTATKSPNGSLDATLVENINGQCTTFVISNAPTAVGFYTRSLFVKPNAANAILIFDGTGTGALNTLSNTVQFNAIARTWQNTTNCIDYGYELYPNGWIRVWIIVGKTAGNSLDSVYYIGAYGGAAPSNAMFVFGHQYELGKCVTSYIPTSGAAVTRAIDSLTIPAKYIPQTEGTFVLDGVSTSRLETPNPDWKRILSLNSMDWVSYKSDNAILSLDGTSTLLSGIFATISDKIALGYSLNTRKISANGSAVVNGALSYTFLNNTLIIGKSTGSTNVLNGTIKRLTIYSRLLTDTELVKVTSATLSSNQAGGIPANADLGQLAFVDATTILSVPNRQELSVDGTAASVSRNIRRPYDFSFAIVDSSGVTITSQPAASCLANTDNALIFTAPVGKTITYAIIPYFEY